MIMTSVRLSVTLCIVALWIGVGGQKLYRSVGGHFLFIFAVGCIV